jgi:hypothetical protein
MRFHAKTKARGLRGERVAAPRNDEGRVRKLAAPVVALAEQVEACGAVG